MQQLYVNSQRSNTKKNDVNVNNEKKESNRTNNKNSNDVQTFRPNSVIANLEEENINSANKDAQDLIRPKSTLNLYLI